VNFFNRFKKKPAVQPSPEPPSPPAPPPAEPAAPEKDTMCLLLMDRTMASIAPAIAQLQETFGPQATGPVDDSHPKVPALTVTLDGIDFWCSYLPMPVPQSELDLSTLVQGNLFLSPQERKALCETRSFWVLAQKGGGTSLAEKRRVCWTFSLLCHALLQVEGAQGVSVNNMGLLVSKRSYCNHVSQMAGTSLDNGDGYFPVPLWVWLHGAWHEGKRTVQTRGLKDFGLPEMGFFDPQRPVGEILNYLFTMASRQITGREHYENGILVPLDEKTQVVCKSEGEILFFTGA